MWRYKRSFRDLELFDGNPPFKGRGAVSFAMNVAEILRVLYLLSKYNY